MSSIVPGFEYDIFISYRHNDNRSAWVTEFVNALQDELAATIKEPFSIYFDKNPHDGLLETHNVDKSLEGKLKCLIFIPILSQTYCDPKSFAWQYEFCAFNKLAQEDQFGRDIRLNNRNVASRILPVKIHDLDLEDKALLERELNSVLRAVEFIYKEPGVNRPLKSTDNKADNQNRTDYRNQVNKVANAIKEIIASLKNPTIQEIQTSYKEQPTAIRFKNKKPLIAIVSIILLFSLTAYFLYPTLFSLANKETAIEQSIAVLSFVDMSPNKDQEYLGDGMAEEILNALTKIEGLKVIGRTSSFSFKGKDADLKTIGETLGATTILEGSIQKSGIKIRITAQLINAADETHIWSERYESEVEDIFPILDDIATQIVQKLKVTLFNKGENKINIPTSNMEAYETFLRARYFKSKGLDGLQTALKYYEQTIALDPSFALAYVELASVYWYYGIYDMIGQTEAFSKSKEAALKAVALDESDYNGYNMLSLLNLSQWEWQSSLKNYEEAVSLGLPLPDLWHAYYQLWLFGSSDQIIKEAEMIVEKDPLSVEALTHLSRIYLYSRRYEDVIKTGNRTLKLSPDQNSAFRHMGEAYLFSSRPALAMPYFQKLMEKDQMYVPHDFIAAHIESGNRKIALEKINELKGKISNTKIAVCYIYLGETDKAFELLEQACNEKDSSLAGIKVDPHFDRIRSDPRYFEILRKMNLPE